VALPEGVFTIRNLDTGEEIDLRDMHKEHFSETFSRVLEMESA